MTERKRGQLVKIKKKKRVTLSFEVTVELEPGDGALKIRVAADEKPKIIPNAKVATCHVVATIPTAQH